MRETLREMRTRLRAIYPDGEAEAIIRIIFEYLKGWSPVDIVMHEDTELSDYIKGKIEQILVRLEHHEPIQYITGSERFYGLELKVTPDVLIPRPETAELIDLILEQWGERSDLQVLDAGTGSGCIALALARNLRFPQITAIDNSPKALAVAADNAKSLKARIRLTEQDMLHMPHDIDKWDIIVSNPPYIADSEAQSMEANVLDWEPHSALFVPDADPLCFFRALSRYAVDALKEGGRIYFEINPLYLTPLTDMMTSLGLQSVTPYRDSFGKYRFVSAIKGEQS